MNGWKLRPIRVAIAFLLAYEGYRLYLQNYIAFGGDWVPFLLWVASVLFLRSAVGKNGDHRFRAFLLASLSYCFFLLLLLRRCYVLQNPNVDLVYIGIMFGLSLSLPFLWDGFTDANVRSRFRACVFCFTTIIATMLCVAFLLRREYGSNATYFLDVVKKNDNSWVSVCSIGDSHAKSRIAVRIVTDPTEIVSVRLPKSGATVVTHDDTGWSVDDSEPRYARVIHIVPDGDGKVISMDSKEIAERFHRMTLAK